MTSQHAATALPTAQTGNGSGSACSLVGYPEIFAPNRFTVPARLHARAQGVAGNRPEPEPGPWVHPIDASTLPEARRGFHILRCYCTLVRYLPSLVIIHVRPFRRDAAGHP